MMVALFVLFVTIVEIVCRCGCLSLVLLPRLLFVVSYSLRLFVVVVA